VALTVLDGRKIHDLLIEGVELALKKHGYPPISEMKAKLDESHPLVQMAT
jgi:hypothetical protein